MFAHPLAGKGGPGLTLDGQGGLCLLVANSKAVLPGLGPLDVLDDEPVHQTILLEDEPVLGAELEAGSEWSRSAQPRLLQAQLSVASH